MYLKYTTLGAHYLETGNYAKGEAVFRQALKADPADPEANYFLGRFLLAGNKVREALVYLQKAVKLDPYDADKNFWLGVAWGENGDKRKERQMYTLALTLDPDHLQSLIYLGHVQLNDKEYTAALQSYEKALKLWPSSPSALYNRALILKILGRTPEERIAWLEYLARYPSGGLARRAADHLNMLGDFSYRNHRLGARVVTLAKIAFKPFEARLESSSHPSLKLVGAIVSNMGRGTLQIVVYQKNNKELARRRAVAIRKFLRENFSDLREGRIGISWFSEPEVVTIGGKKMTIDESVRFFLTE
ncbi:MAG: hypothetical protein Kow0089_12380 [Desulfobulbaceae bacterium]